MWIPECYQLVRLGSLIDRNSVAAFADALSRVRSVVNVASLTVKTVHIEAVNPRIPNPIIFGLSTGHRFKVEMRGSLNPFDAENRPGLRVSLWATLRRTRQGSNAVSQIQFEQLCIGVVTDVDLPDGTPLNPELGDVYDITHSIAQPSHPHPGPEDYIPGFPVEWRQHLADHVTAATLNYFIDVYQR